MMIMVITFD